METRKFDNLGIAPSLLGFGCMRFPLNGEGKIDREKSTEMLDYAIKNGVTYIDTAKPYHGGESEEFLGVALQKYPRDSFFLATKMSFWMLPNKSLEEAKEFFENQLKTLNTPYIDFYLLHALDKETWECAKTSGILDYLVSQKEEGKIKYLGFSFHDTYEVFEDICTYRKWDFCQIQYNYVDRNIQAGDKGYELCERLEIPMVIMEPIKGGSLATLPEDITKPFTDYDASKSTASWALRWVASHPNIKVILSGMTTMEQVVDNVETFSTLSTLNEEEHALVEKVANDIHSRIKVGCTACQYCMPCPAGVKIPHHFRLWNDLSMYGNKDSVVRRYHSMVGEEGSATNCIECGACESLCPQNIEIRDMLKEAHKALKEVL